MRNSKKNFIGTTSVLAFSALLFPTEFAQANMAQANMSEENTYHLKLMAQTFDGQKEFSNTQTSTVQRMRRGNESYTLFDFGDGSVVIEAQGEQLAASSFENTSGIEAEFLYNYDTKTLSGSNDAARYFNTHVRPYLHGAPQLGSNAEWNKTVSLRALGVSQASGGQVKIELKRTYFAHDGKDYVLLHYQVPAFAYRTAAGQDVVHWGEGVTVTDPGFGEVYWNATLQRALAEEADGTKRPYRIAKTMTATDDQGIPIFDPREIDETKDYFASFYGGEKMEVMGFHGSLAKPDQSPILLAANLDVMAMAIAENSANPAPQLSSQYLNGNTGMNVRRKRTPIQLYKPSTPISSPIAFEPERQAEPAVYPQEQTHQAQSASRISGTSNVVERPASSSIMEQLQAPVIMYKMTQPKRSAGAGAGDMTDGSRVFGPDPMDPSSQVYAEEQRHVVSPSEGRTDDNRRYGAPQDNIRRGGNAAPEYDSSEIPAEAQLRGPAGGQSPIQMRDFVTASGGGSGTGAGGSSAGASGGDNGVGAVSGTFGTVRNIIGGLGGGTRTVRSGEGATDGAGDLDNTIKVAGLATGLLSEARVISNTSKAYGKEFAGLMKEQQALVKQYKRATNGMKDVGELSGAALKIFNQITVNTNKLTSIQSKMDGLASQITGFRAGLARLPTAEAKKVIDGIADSQGAKFLGGITAGLDVLSIGSSVGSIGTAAGTDLGSGELKLNRDYGTLASAGQLAFDLAAIAGDVSTGDMKGALLASTELATATAADLFIVVKGYRDTNRIISNSYALGAELATAKRQQTFKKSYERRQEMRETIEGSEDAIGEFSDHLDDYDLNPKTGNYDPRIDQDSGLPKPNFWGELKKTEGGRARLRRMGIDPDAPVGTLPGTTSPSVSPEVKKAREIDIIRRQNEITREENAERKAAFKEAFRIKYPQVDRKTIKKIAKKYPQFSVLSPETLAEIKASQDNLKQQEENAEKLKEYQTNFLEGKRKEQEAREEARRKRIQGSRYVDPATRAAEEAQNAAEKKEAEERAKKNSTLAGYQENYIKEQKEAEAKKKEERKERIQGERYVDPETRAAEEAQIAADKEEAEARRKKNSTLAGYQDNYIKERKEAEAKKEADRRRRIKEGGLDVTPIKTSEIKVSPIGYTPPKYTPPKYNPPVYHPPKPAPIKHSEIPFSNSDDWTTGTGIVSNDYNRFTGSGTFNPDLSEWAEWLATQNLRELKRIARSAGYPNLAAALRDAKNLMRQANDAGYRQWAMRAPVCYMACAGLIGSWHIKSSQLALGDILNDSREIFSTAGLSDVSISGFTLRYLLRDFGVEDGDNINIVISQFGRSIFETDLSLLNAGTDFEINLRPGVASIVITAIDEGAISPNTAEITLQNVVEGESTQTYSLATGETATLRVNPGRVGGGINQPSNTAQETTPNAPTLTGPTMVDLSRDILNRRLLAVDPVGGFDVSQSRGATGFVAPLPVRATPTMRGRILRSETLPARVNIDGQTRPIDVREFREVQ